MSKLNKTKKSRSEKITIFVIWILIAFIIFGVLSDRGVEGESLIVGTFGLVFLFFTQGFSLFSPVFAFALVSPILFLLYVPFVFNTFNLLHYKVKHFKTHTKKLFSFGVPVFATAVGGKIIGYLDTLFLTYFSNWCGGIHLLNLSQ